MSALIALSYFALDAALAGVVARKRPGVHFASAFFLLFAGGAAVLQLLVTLHLPLRLAFALLCAAKLLVLVWRLADLRALFRETNGRDLATVVAFLFVTTFLVARKGLIFWDDWSNWASIAKRLWHHDGLPDPNEGGYFDYMLLQGFYWAAFHFPGEPFQEKLGPALTWLVYAVAMLRIVPGGRPLYFVVTTIAPFAFSVEVFGTTYADGMVAVGFALLALEIWNLLEDEGDAFALVGPALLLLFAKPVGVYLIAIALIACWTVLFFRLLTKTKAPGNENEAGLSIKTAGRLSLILLGLTLGKYLLLKAFLWQTGAAEAQSLARGPLEAYQAGYLHAYLRAVREQIFINERFLFILPALLVVNLALLPASLRINRVYFFFLALVGNACFIIPASLLVFSEQEIRRAASFARYQEHVYLFGLALALESAAGIYAALSERFGGTDRRPRIALMTCFVLATVYVFGGFVYFHYKHPLLKKTEKVAAACARNQGRFMTLSQRDSGLFRHVAGLPIYPQRNDSQWQVCPTDKNHEGYQCLAMRDAAEFRGYLQRIDFIVLVQADDYLKKVWPPALPYPAELPACVDVRPMHD